MKKPKITRVYPHFAELTFIPFEEDTDYPDRGWVLMIRDNKNQIVLSEPTGITFFNTKGENIRQACIGIAKKYGFIPPVDSWVRNEDHRMTATFIINPPRV